MKSTPLVRQGRIEYRASLKQKEAARWIIAQAPGSIHRVLEGGLFMSATATDWAWGLPNVRPKVRLTLLAMARSADKDGRGIIRLPTLARLRGIPTEVVLQQLERMAAEGLLEIEVRTNTDGTVAPAYRLLMDAAREEVA